MFHVYSSELSSVCSSFVCMYSSSHVCLPMYTRRMFFWLNSALIQRTCVCTKCQTHSGCHHISMSYYVYYPPIQNNTANHSVFCVKSDKCYVFIAEDPFLLFKMLHTIEIHSPHGENVQTKKIHKRECS